MNGPCSLPDCDRPAYCKTWCRRHYARWQKHGDPAKLVNALPGQKPPCAVDDCGQSAAAKGLCPGHWRRQRYGHPDPRGNLHPTSAERMWRYINVGESCWEWIGARNAWGYGKYRGDNRDRSAHRFVYETLVGPVPDGLQLDHLCRNRACVNPAHLEPVTGSENVRRGWAARREEGAA